MKLNGKRRALALAGVACAAVLLTAPEAKAITITVNTTFLGGNTANNSDTSPPVAQNLSAVSTPDSGGSAPDVVSSSVDSVSRYTSVTTADSDAANFASITRNATHSYRVTVTIDAANGLDTYDIEIDTERLGALVVRNEGGASGQAAISGVTGLINGVGNAGLGLADIADLNTNSTTVTQINQSNSLTVSGVGDAVYTFDFTWTSSAGSGNNVLSGGDEGAVILGMQGTVSQVAGADDYPGTSGRSNGLAEDGHWTTVTVTLTSVVPEPSSIALAGLGALGVGFAAWRRRRTA
jgi:hypothetical protein